MPSVFSLCLIDFIEALARISSIVGLPTPVDLASLPRASAFLFMEKLRRSATLVQWERENAVPWGQLPERSLARRFPLLVELVDEKLRRARNICHFINKKYDTDMA